MATRPRGLSAVGRLYRILRKGTDKDGSRPTLEVWAELFSVEPPGVTPQAVTAVGQLFGLIAEAQAEARTHPDLDEELFIAPLEHLSRELLTQSLNSRWTEIVNVYSRHLSKLAYCADRLDERAQQVEPASSDLDTLRQEVENLLQRLRDSAIGEPARSEFASRIEDLRSAIVRYSFAGTEPIKVAAEAVVGAVVVATERQPAKGENWRTTCKDILLIAQAAFNLVEKGYRAAPVLGPAVSEWVARLLKAGQ